MKIIAATLLLRPAMAVGSIALLPVLGWQAGIAAPPQWPVAETVQAETASQPSLSETVVAKSGSAVAWSKSDKVDGPRRLVAAGKVRTAHPLPQGVRLSTKPIIEVVSVEAPAQVDPALRPGSNANAAFQRPFADWLQAGPAAGSMEITDFKTRKLNMSRSACRARHGQIAAAFGLSGSAARIMADKAVLFQSRLCAENGEVVITCFGGSATVSPRQARSGSQCNRQG